MDTRPGPPKDAQHILLANAVRLMAGAERFLLDAADGLAERGYRITIQAYPDSPLAADATERGHAVHPVYTRADGAPWTVAPLIQWIEKNEVDVVLSNYEKDLRTVAWAARLSRRQVAVIHSRECDIPLKNLPHYRFFYNRVAHHILANSHATRRNALASAPWLSPSHISVLHKGVDIGAYGIADGREWRSHWNANPEEAVIGFAGQLVPRKRCRLLFEALASDVLRRRPWRLVIAGIGPEEPALRELAQVLGISNRVIFCGFVESMPEWMRAIDILVLPSLVEGFGYVLAEAAAAGTPCVAYRSSSVPEVVSHGETGLLADPELENSLLHALTPLLDDADLRSRMGMSALDHARRHFSLDTMIEQLETRIAAVYARIVDTDEAPLAPNMLDDDTNGIPQEKRQR